MDETPLAVLTAVANPSLEAELVAALGRHDLGVTVVRRCVDIVDLLAAASAGTAQGAIVSADLRGLDREALAHLARCGVVTVGLADDDAGERLLHQLGAAFVLAAGASPEQVAGALRAAAAAPPDLTSPTSLGNGHGSVGGRPSAPPLEKGTGVGFGRSFAVWGPAGAPGRTTVALGLADALAKRGLSTLLIDADPYGGAVATLTGLLDEAPGLIAACRAGNAGLLDVPRLAECCRQLAPGLRVLTGLGSAVRWPELRPSAFELVLSLGRRLADVTVVDCGFCLEEDEDLAYDTVAPRRNAATLAALRSADTVVAVGSADPVGLSRLVRELPRLAVALDESLDALTASRRVLVTANRLRSGLLAGNPRRSVEDALVRHSGAALFAALPMDVAAADAAHGRGLLLSEAAPQSALHQSLAELAGSVSTSPGKASTGAGRERRPRLPWRRQRTAAAR